MHIDENHLSTKDKILYTTLKILKKEGIENITTRKVAKEAKVNIALINYHFGSKDNLINEAIKIIMLELQKLLDTLDKKEIEPKKRLKLFLSEYVEIAGENSSIIRKGISDYGRLFQSQIEMVTFIKQMGLGKIKSVIKEITDIEDEKKLNHTTLQLIGSIFFPVVVVPVLGQEWSIESSGRENVDEYIDTLINNMFK